MIACEMKGLLRNKLKAALKLCVVQTPYVRVALSMVSIDFVYAPEGVRIEESRMQKDLAL